VAELFAHVDARPELIAWRQGSCLPYGEGITFWALGEIVKAHAGIWSQMQSMSLPRSWMLFSRKERKERGSRR